MARHPVRPTITRAMVCKDGFSMSVQASDRHYCFPLNNTGPWSKVEVGYPSIVEPLLWEYAESPWQWTDTVYPRVPVEVVAAVIEVHGGLVEE